MKKQISKKNLDEAIRLHKEFLRTGNRRIFPVIHEKLDQTFGEEAGCWAGDILLGIAYMRNGQNEPYKTYYKVFEALGYTIDGKA